MLLLPPLSLASFDTDPLLSSEGPLLDVVGDVLDAVVVVAVEPALVSDADVLLSEPAPSSGPASALQAEKSAIAATSRGCTVARSGSNASRDSVSRFFAWTGEELDEGNPHVDGQLAPDTSAP